MFCGRVEGVCQKLKEKNSKMLVYQHPPTGAPWWLWKIAKEMELQLCDCPLEDLISRKHSIICRTTFWPSVSSACLVSLDAYRITDHHESADSVDQIKRERFGIFGRPGEGSARI